MHLKKDLKDRKGGALHCTTKIVKVRKKKKFNAAPLENRLFPGKRLHFFRPEKSLATLSGGGKRCRAILFSL